MKQFFVGFSVFISVIAAQAANFQCDATIYSVRDGVTHHKKIVTSLSAHNKTVIDGVTFEAVTPDKNNIWLQIDAPTAKSRIRAESGQKLQTQFVMENGDNGVATYSCATK